MWKQQFRRGKNVGREMKLFADKGVYSGRHIIFVRYLPEDAIEFPVFRAFVFHTKAQVPGQKK